MERDPAALSPLQAWFDQTWWLGEIGGVSMN
jgi:hypothetical protein